MRYLEGKNGDKVHSFVFQCLFRALFRGTRCVFPRIRPPRLVVNGATRNAQCATDNLSVIPWAFGTQCITRRRPFDSERGGLSNFVWTYNLYSTLARPGNFFSCGMAWVRENLFSCKHGVTTVTVRCTEAEAITRNSSAIESSRILLISNYKAIVNKER